MEKDPIDNYEKLINEEMYFDISKEDLSIIVEPGNISSKESYRHIQKLGGIQKILNRLEVNPQYGLEFDPDPRSAQSKRLFLRKKFFGKNDPFLPNYRSFIRCLWDVIKNQFMLFLLFAATLKMVVNILYNNGKFFDYCSIYVVVIVISVTTSFTKYSCERVFANYQVELDYREVRVIRNRTEKLIPKSELVVGDILIINSGDITPVDGIIIQAYTISISNGAREVIKYSNINYNKPEKQNACPVILSGSKVLKGYAYLLVLSVGKDAYINKAIPKGQEIEIPQQRSNSISQEADSSQGSVSEKNQMILSGDKGGTHSDSEKLSHRLSSRRRYSFNENLLYEDFEEVLREMSIKEKQIKENEGAADSFSTSLNRKLNTLLLFHSKIGMLAGAITGLLFVITFFKGNLINDLGYVILDAFLYAIVLIIVAVPNGATLSSSLPLAFSINKMREEKTLVKNPEAYEFMASVNCICTDYYGILTKDVMEIYSIFIEDTTVEGRDLRNLREVLSEDMLSFFCENISINTIAFSAEKDGDLQYFGDSIECCLIKYLSTIGIDYRQLRNNPERPVIDLSPYTPENKISYAIISMEDKWEYKRLYVKGTPDTLLEYISVYIEPGQVLEQFTQRHYEKVRSKCNSLLREGCFPVIICYRDIPNDMYNQAKEMYGNNENDFMINIVRQLTFICLIGLKDEIKPDVESYISNCKDAGVHVKMVTAKDKETACMAAIKCGIIDPLPTNNIDIEPSPSMIENTIMRFINEDSSKIALSAKSSEQKDAKRQRSRSSQSNAGNRSDIVDAIDGIRKFVEVRYLKNESTSSHSFELAVSDYHKFYRYLENALVICRAQAKDKFILVSALKEKGYCVAVTGEGVSDSIAMKAAHVGISMGYKSTDITKEAADVILVDDNFKSIITAIVYGRNIYDSVRKFLQFQITATIAIVFFTVLTSCPFFKYYFYPNQLLWINLIINALEALALASEEPDQEAVLKKSPGDYSMNKKLINRQMVLRIIVQSSIQVIVLTLLLFFAPVVFGVDDDTEIQYVNWKTGNGYHSTIIFNCIVFMLIFNAFISRNLDQNSKWIFSNLDKSKIFLSMQFFILSLQLPLINWGEFVIRTKPLSIYQILICLLISSVTLLTLPIVNSLSGRFLQNEWEEAETQDVHNNDYTMNMAGEKNSRQFSRTNYISLKIVQKEAEANSYTS